MDFTQKQVRDILTRLLEEENGLNTVLKLTLEALMKSERTEYNFSNGDSSNGYRPRKSYGNGQMLELQVPGTRNGNFYPIILGLLKNQDSEAHNIAFHLYKSGLTTEQVGEVFGEIYGAHYSTSQVSRMFETAREEVSAWLNRPLNDYYPIVYGDATFIPTRRVDSVSKDAYFTVLGVRPDRTREVLGVYNYPTESSTHWEAIFEGLKDRGVKEIGLFVSDSLPGIEDSVAKHFSQTDVQLCVVHLQRAFLKEVKPKHKGELSEDFKEVFYRNDSGESIESAKERFVALCDKWGKLYPYFKTRKSNERNDSYFTYLQYDYRIRSMIYSTNWIERLNRDYKRTTRMRGALPSPEATLLLLGGVAMSRKAYDIKVSKLDYEKERFRWD